jgi:hypothetical protein
VSESGLSIAGPGRNTIRQDVMRFPVSLTTVGLLLAGCGDGGLRDKPTGPEWQPDPAQLSQLEPEREILSGAATIQPPRGYELTELDLSDPAAAFVNEPNRIEILQINGLGEDVTRQEHTKEVREMLQRTSDLDEIEIGEIEHGSVGGVAFSRFRYQGLNDEETPTRGVYLIARPLRPGPIWNVVAEGTEDVFPLLEASLLTFRAEG